MLRIMKLIYSLWEASCCGLVLPRPRIDTLPRVCFGSECPFAYGLAWPFPGGRRKEINTKINAHLSGLPLIAPLDSNAEYISCSDRDISINYNNRKDGLVVLSRLCAECRVRCACWCLWNSEEAFGQMSVTSHVCGWCKKNGRKARLPFTQERCSVPKWRTT